MIINVLPDRLIRTADELRRTERKLTLAAYDIEEVISGLSHSDDEAFRIAAEKLSKTLENLQRRIFITRLLATAASRIASVYMKTETDIEDYENEASLMYHMRYKAQDISDMRNRVSGIFKEL
ncbi:MAG: hypothetical protein IJH92_06250 [Mogibacterium sp.]|nr:hypothetical protein [Mogibacterium sp.]